MKGFDPKFRDFPDYMIGITKEIWEDRGIATLHRYYAPEIVVRSPPQPTGPAPTRGAGTTTSGAQDLLTF